MARASNTNVVETVGAPASAVGDDATWVSAWSASTGGDFLARAQLTTDPDALTLGENYRVAAGAIVFEQLPGTNETEAMAQRKVRGAIAGGVWFQFHTADPGTNGTSSAILELPRIRVPETEFTIS